MKTHSQFIQLDSLVDLSAALHQCNDEKTIARLMALTIMGKLVIHDVHVFLYNDERTLIRVYGKGDKQYNANDFTDYRKFTIQSRETHYGILIIGSRLIEPFDREADQYCKLITSIGANALQSLQAKHELLLKQRNIESANQMLETLFSLHKDFALAHTEHEIIRLSGYLIMGQLMVKRYAIIDMREDKPTCLVNRLGVPDLEIAQESLLQTFLHNSNLFSTYFNPTSPEHPVFIPLMVRDLCIGYIICCPYVSGNTFSPAEINFLETLASMTAIALENERLLKEEITKRSMEKELHYAREIQGRLFPSKDKNYKGLDIEGVNIPSKEVGGDYYDIIHKEDGSLIVLIADVAGKGLPASLIMANMQAAFRVLSQLSLSPADIMHALHTILYQNTSSDIFVTAFCCQISPDRTTMRYCNAGHHPPLLIDKDREIRELCTGGIILGILDEIPMYAEEEITLHSNDVLLLYTDGVTEYKNPKSEEWGTENLKKIVVELIPRDVPQIMQGIIEMMSTFGEIERNQDDITMVIVKIE